MSSFSAAMGPGQVAGPRLRSKAFVGDASFAAMRPASVQQRGALQVVDRLMSSSAILEAMHAELEMPPAGQVLRVCCALLVRCVPGSRTLATASTPSRTRKKSQMP